MELTEEELGLRYQSFCDPRLNFEQSLGAESSSCCFLTRKCADGCLLIDQIWRS